jgi:deoxyadenosine/deoxycytidine kinase
MESPRYVVVEGCIGAGKTTLAKGMAALATGKALLEESGRHPFIKEFYDNPSAYAVETELAFLLLHYHQILREKGAGTFESAVFADFAFERDYVFSTLTLKNREDWQLFQQTYDILRRRIPDPDVLVYLRAPLEFLIERIARRGREYERSMPREFVESVRTALDDYFLNKYRGRILVVDAPELDAIKDPNFAAAVLRKLPWE